MPAFWEHLVTQSLPIIINQFNEKFAQSTLSSFESFKLKPTQIWLPCMKMIWSNLTLGGAGCVLKKTWFKLRCGMVCLGWWDLWVDGCMVYYGLVWHGWVRGMVVRCMAWLSEAEHAMRVQLCQALLYIHLATGQLYMCHIRYSLPLQRWTEPKEVYTQLYQRVGEQGSRVK